MNSDKKPRVGVLAMQGDFDAHIKAVNAAGGDGFAVRNAEQIEDAGALILPGGESTVMGKLFARYGLDTAIRQASEQGKPIFGTCAGMILLADRIAHGAKRGGQPTLGLMNISVARNAFGRQLDSFETDIDAPNIAGGETLRGVFIRAPFVEEVGPDVTVLARYEDRIVLVRQDNLLAAAFHPELTDDVRLHRYFLQMISPRPNTDKAH